jgi:CheY-like chemotaxis protein
VTAPRSRTLRRTLVVENHPDRIAWFREKLAGHDITVATAYQQAVEALARRRFHWVFLDHDLDSPSANGQDVAAWAADHLRPTKRPALVVVHSSSAAGALGIFATLRAAGFKVETDPFPPRRAEQPRSRPAPKPGTYSADDLVARGKSAYVTTDDRFVLWDLALVTSRRKGWRVSDTKVKGNALGFVRTLPAALKLINDYVEMERKAIPWRRPVKHLGLP